MSKRAEKAAQKIFRPIDKRVVNLVSKQELIDYQNLRMEQKEQYIAGYEQAEKDLALSWEDIKNLDYLMNDVEFENKRADTAGKDIPFNSDESFYGEILKRFNAQRNESKNHKHASRG